MKILYGAALVAVCASGASADFVGVVGGQTSVDLDFDLIASATGLEYAGVSDGVIVPGNLGKGSVAFAITSPFSANLPTSFSYDPDDFFGTFSGSIEHRGSVMFDGAADVTVGNFSVAYDAVAGFQVIDNLDLGVAMFNVANIKAEALVDTLDVRGNLEIANEFAMLLIELGLTEDDLTGVDVGEALVQGINQAVPGPGVLAAFAVAGIAARRRRRG
jgi:MYXO-CTERM domain-containing protein